MVSLTGPARAGCDRVPGRLASPPPWPERRLRVADDFRAELFIGLIGQGGALVRDLEPAVRNVADDHLLARQGLGQIGPAREWAAPCHNVGSAFVTRCEPPCVTRRSRGSRDRREDGACPRDCGSFPNRALKAAMNSRT
jgi:hypothetical protein